MKVEYEIYIEPDDTPIEGNISASGNALEDEEAEQWVRNALENGNDYAWCWARVTAKAHGRMGTAALGAISCRGPAEFRRVFLPDLKDEALADLCTKLAQDALLDGTEETPEYLGE